MTIQLVGFLRLGRFWESVSNPNKSFFSEILSATVFASLKLLNRSVAGIEMLRADGNSIVWKHRIAFEKTYWQ